MAYLQRSHSTPLQRVRVLPHVSVCNDHLAPATASPERVPVPRTSIGTTGGSGSQCKVRHSQFLGHDHTRHHRLPALQPNALGNRSILQEERFNGTIESLFLTPANRMTILLASGFSSLLEGAWWIVGVFLLSWVIFGVQPAIADWGAVIIALISTMIALVAVGVFFASFFVLTRAADQLATSLQAPIRYASGVAFPVAALPAVFQLFAYILPVTYGIDALRRTVVQQGTLIELAGTLAPLYLFTAILIVAGHFMLRRVEAQAKRNGSLYKI